MYKESEYIQESECKKNWGKYRPRLLLTQQKGCWREIILGRDLERLRDGSPTEKVLEMPRTSKDVHYSDYGTV